MAASVMAALLSDNSVGGGQQSCSPSSADSASYGSSSGLERRRSPPSSSSIQTDGQGLGEWVQGEVLGRGAYGVVYRGLLRNGSSVAVKQIHTDGMGESEQRAVENEILMMRSLRHPNVVTYLGVEQVENHLNIFIEYVNGGSLRKLLQRTGPMVEAQAASNTYQLLEGLRYLHSRGISHRDVKSANILVCRDGTLKLADFGASKRTGHESVLSGLKGTPHWMAPEVIRGQQTAKGWYKADVWSVGCTLVEMLTGRMPWPDIPNPMAAMYRIANGEQPPVDCEISPQAEDFIGRCCKANPAQRQSARELLEQPFMVAARGKKFVWTDETGKTSVMVQERWQQQQQQQQHGPSPPTHLEQSYFDHEGKEQGGSEDFCFAGGQSQQLEEVPEMSESPPAPRPPFHGESPLSQRPPCRAKSKGGRADSNGTAGGAPGRASGSGRAWEDAMGGSGGSSSGGGGGNQAHGRQAPPGRVVGCDDISDIAVLNQARRHAQQSAADDEMEGEGRHRLEIALSEDIQPFLSGPGSSDTNASGSHRHDATSGSEDLGLDGSHESAEWHALQDWGSGYARPTRAHSDQVLLRPRAGEERAVLRRKKLHIEPPLSSESPSSSLKHFSSRPRSRGSHSPGPSSSLQQYRRPKLDSRQSDSGHSPGPAASLQHYGRPVLESRHSEPSPSQSLQHAHYARSGGSRGRARMQAETGSKWLNASRSQDMPRSTALMLLNVDTGATPGTSKADNLIAGRFFEHSPPTGPGNSSPGTLSSAGSGTPPDLAGHRRSRAYRRMAGYDSPINVIQAAREAQAYMSSASQAERPSDPMTGEFLKMERQRGQSSQRFFSGGSGGEGADSMLKSDKRVLRAKSAGVQGSPKLPPLEGTPDTYIPLRKIASAPTNNINALSKHPPGKLRRSQWALDPLPSSAVSSPSARGRSSSFARGSPRDAGSSPSLREKIGMRIGGGEFSSNPRASI